MLPHRFDPDTLRRLSGDRVFARGEAYFREGAVELLDCGPERALALVAGTESYRTLVTVAAGTVDGECSCPAFAREGFCKHMVAVALAADAAGAGRDDGRGTLAQVRSYLATRDRDSLVDMIIDIAGWDVALLRKLELAAAASGADDDVLQSQLRDAIGEATRTGGFVEYSQAPRWAAGVDAVLDALAEIAQGRAALVIELVDYAIARVEDALAEIDDSAGYGGALLARAQLVHLEACEAARPDPVALARDLFRREMEAGYDTFYGAAAQYADVLGAEGLAEYRRLAQEAWEELPTRIGPSRDARTPRFDGFRLQAMLDRFAERDGDLEMRIALRAKDLASPWSYYQLADFCRTHGREEEALRHAEEGLWLFEDEQPDERLVFLAVDLLLEAGREADAEAWLWRAFKKTPSLALFGRLREAGGKPAAERAIALLQERLVGQARVRWLSPADLLIEIMLEEKMFEAAWSTLREHGASRGVKDVLARASETTHPQEALAVYRERVEGLAEAGGNPAYEEAAALIDHMAGLCSPEEQVAYLADIKERFRRKRNFMKLLGGG